MRICAYVQENCRLRICAYEETMSILKKAVPIPKIEEQQRLLFVGPHPDDVEVACGGTVAKLAAAGKQITFLVVTNGCVGSVNGLEGETLVQTRQKEALASAALLGVSDVIFLPYDDGCGYDLRQVTRDIVKVILDKKPQMVFCPDYTVPSECHPDHLNVGKAVTDALFFAQWQPLTSRLGLFGCVKQVNVAYYYTHAPNAYVGVKKTSKLHMQAIACHKSQFTEADLKQLSLYFTLRELRFGLPRAKWRAEGFRVLAPVHQHCFPEASLF